MAVEAYFHWLQWLKTDFRYDWQFLRDFFGLQVLRYLVTWFALVPLAVVVLGRLPSEIHIPTLRGEVTLVVALPFKWWVLWLSSFFYVLALAIYQMRCPVFIRRYKHYEAYRNWGHSERWIVWEWHNFLKRDASPDDINRLVSKELAIKCDQKTDLNQFKQVRRKADVLRVFDPVKAKDETWFLLERHGDVFRIGLGPMTKDVNVIHSELFWELYGARASSRLVSRASVWILLALAGLLFIFPVLQNIIAVVGYLANQWIGVR